MSPVKRVGLRVLVACITSTRWGNVTYRKQRHSVTRDIASGLAVYVLYLLCAAWLVVAAMRIARMSFVDAARIALLLLLAALLAQALNGLISDPRPDFVALSSALTPVRHDNGFPSDHTLLASALTASLR